MSTRTTGRVSMAILSSSFPAALSMTTGVLLFMVALLLSVVLSGCDSDRPLALSQPPIGSTPPECERLMTTDWDLGTARQMARLSQEVGGGQSNNDEDCWQRLGFLQTPGDFVCSEDFGDGVQEEDTQLRIFTDEHSSDLAVAFRSTQNVDDVQTDVQSKRVDWQQEDHDPASGQVTLWTVSSAVHRGMFCAYESVEDQLKDRLLALIDEHVVDRATARIYFTGHSLGGGLAVLGALDLADWLVDSLGYSKNNVVVYTFAAPRVITDALYPHYQEFVPHSWQVAAKWDVVPHYAPLRYTHTHNMAVLNSHIRVPWNWPSDNQFESARIDFGDGRDFGRCQWVGNYKPNFVNHNIEIYKKRLNNIMDPGIPDIGLSVDAGLMRMNWSGNLKGPCDRVALYRGNPLSGGEFVLGTREWALQDVNGTKLTDIAKGPRYYLVYANGFSQILKAVKYEPQIPKLRVEKTLTGLLRVHWDVDDEGLHDFVAIYDHEPTDGNVGDYLTHRKVILDLNDTWTTTRRYERTGRWIAYVTQEGLPDRKAKILKKFKHIP